MVCCLSPPKKSTLIPFTPIFCLSLIHIYLFLSGGHRVKLTDDGLATDGPIEKVYDGWTFPEDWIVTGFGLEAPKVRRIGDYFYLMCAEGGTLGPPTAHMSVLARSKSINCLLYTSRCV